MYIGRVIYFLVVDIMFEVEVLGLFFKELETYKKIEVQNIVLCLVDCK